MKIKAVKNATAGIHGSTVINHKIRVKLDLTCSEYVVLEYLYERNTVGKKTTVYGEMNDLWKALGMRSDSFAEHVVDLIDLGYIEESNGIIVTEKWIKEFQDPHGGFGEFWKVYGKVGNKENARKMFLKAIKEVTFDHLIIRHAEYVKHLKNTPWKGKMHCSTWLNPSFKRFDDDYAVEEREEETDKFQL